MSFILQMFRNLDAIRVDLLQIWDCMDDPHLFRWSKRHRSITELDIRSLEATHVAYFLHHNLEYFPGLRSLVLRPRSVPCSRCTECFGFPSFAPLHPQTLKYEGDGFGLPVGAICLLLGCATLNIVNRHAGL